jgi:hypothetical protein
MFPVVVSAATEPPQRAATATASPAGEAIYRFGRLPTGRPLRGEREAGFHVEGALAACVNCHRRSGLGELEGRSYIPPITGQFLFHSSTQNPEDIDLPYIEGSRPHRAAYTQDSLARAIREGIDADGRRLGYLMPRYALDDAAMAALTDYLRQLTATSVPGVSDSTLQFATIVTPDADPVKRQGMLAVLNDYFAEKNARTRAVSPELHRYRKVMFRAARQWQLHVWELTGPVSTWDAQLRRFQATEPVFAVISGLGGNNWTPIHRFCEQAALPCLFPNIELPVVAEQDFHSLYFSKGVLLEAGLIASELQARPREPPRRLVQIYREGDVGAAAAAALDAATHGLGLAPLHRELGLGDHADAALATAMKDLGPADELVLWLRPADVAALGATVPKVQHVWMSGQMAHLESAPLPAAWRTDTRMAYPYDLPDGRRIRVDYPLGWFTIRHIPIVDLQVQADTYLACGLLSETLTHMADAFVPDYLIERVEGMVEHRVITGYYPRMTLAQGQRFASKGGYIVRFKDPTGNKVVAASDWIVP